MVSLHEGESVKVYTVNGAASGSSSSLPDWLTRKRAAKGKGKRAVREQVEGTIDLIQHFEFPEASNKIKTTRDGHFAVATGTYKPQMRVYDLDQLTLKFERHSDAENVDFVILSDDWTKTLHLQNDRTIELHNQGGLYYKARIPRFGRAVAYHYPSCDAILAGAGSEVFRLNLDQGRFLNPLNLSEGGSEADGVNVIDINPAHQLLSFGMEGSGGTVQFWDPRSRSRVGLLKLPTSVLSSHSPDLLVNPQVSVTAMSTRSDGLSLAVGTSTGHTLLYDLRSARHFALKDQGYGLPITSLSWIEGGSKMAGDGMVLSADKKVVKIWDKTNPTVNFASVTPATDINYVHHVPESGLIMLANEGIQMTSYYIPQLGPAPRWCSFLDSITEEMEEQTVRSVYEDFKFVERTELARLGLDHLIGTPTLKPYMHGYFLSLKLYDAARLIANPFAYAEHREKVIRDKVDKLAESRIRTRRDNLPKVNKALAERIRKAEEREERRKTQKAPDGTVNEEGDGKEAKTKKMKGKEKELANLLNDPRFTEMFEDPEFEVDDNTREYAMLNPTGAALAAKKRKTAVEDEEDESDKVSSDGLSHSESEDEGEDEDVQSDESDAGTRLVNFKQYKKLQSAADDDPLRSTHMAGSKKQDLMDRYEPKPTQPKNWNQPRTRMVPAHSEGMPRTMSDSSSFGHRREQTGSRPDQQSRLGGGKAARAIPDGGMEMSWVPSSKSRRGTADDPFDPNDMLVPGGKGIKGKKKKIGVEEFGAGMERGGAGAEEDVAENDRSGRTQRRRGVRSGSKNVFRRM